MRPVISAEALIELAKEFDAHGAEGMLVSGGCDKEGKIPLGPFLPALERIKLETDLKINLHTGLVDSVVAAQIAAAGIDCVSFDLVQDPGVIRKRLHLSCGAKAYSDTLATLLSSGVKRVVPHLLVGISGEEDEFEIAAIETAARHPIAGLVIIALMPTKGTPMESVPPPSDDHLLEMVERAIDALDVPVMLGCMRARGSWKLETKAIELGVRGIAMPSHRTEAWAKAQGYRVIERSTCCVF
jgi:lipoyl synthase